MGKQWKQCQSLFFWGSKITADGDCSHEIKRCLLLGRKVMTNLDTILKSRDIILSTNVHLVKAMVFPVVMYGCESWTVKKDECWRIDAFELWCWRRLLRVPWTARRSDQSILKEISPGYTPGVGDRQGGLECCGSWGCKESDKIEWLNWTEEAFKKNLHRRGAKEELTIFLKQILYERPGLRVRKKPVLNVASVRVLLRLSWLVV